MKVEPDVVKWVAIFVQICNLTTHTYTRPHAHTHTHTHTHTQSTPTIRYGRVISNDSLGCEVNVVEYN